ncbi:MAG: hypothetical protein JXA21_27280 [Anaerolineae bacterium]|nr:hypothetical protein [Anaerolineae bacterium]
MSEKQTTAGVDSHEEANAITVNSIVRLGPWHGRVVEILTSDSTGEKYARVKLIKHAPGVTEIHPFSALKVATLSEAEWELKVMQDRYAQAWQEVLCVH